MGLPQSYRVILFQTQFMVQVLVPRDETGPLHREYLHYGGAPNPIF